MPSPKTQWNRWLPPGLLLLAWAALYEKVLFSGQTFVLEDSSRFFYPLWKWGAEVWQKGWIPLWNPDAGFGTPYLADPQMAVWYPPLRFFYAFFFPTTSFTLLILLHHLWALLGFWLFSRGRGFSPWTALGGTLIFGFSFNAISLSWATPMLFAFSWIPWVSLGMDSLGQARKGSLLILSLALSMQMAAGYPLFSYMTLLVTGGEWLLNHSIGGWRRNWKGELTLGTAALLAALVYNAAWLLPFKEFIPYSNLSERKGLPESLGWSDLATWLNPFFKGHPLYSHPGMPFSVTVYFAGLPTLVVLTWVLWSRKSSKQAVILFFILVLLSLGRAAYAGEWLKEILPGYDLIVRSGYWIPFILWVLARLFLEGDQLLAGIKGPQGSWFITVILIYASAIFLGVPWELSSFWLSLFFLLGAGWPRHFSPNGRRVLLVLSLTFSLGPVARSIGFTMDRSYYDQPPAALSRISAPGRIYNAPSVEDHFQNVSGNGVADAYIKLKEAMVSNWPLAFGLQETGFNNALFLKPFLLWYYAPFWEGGSPEILNYLNGRYVTGWMPFLNGPCPMWAGTVPLWDNPDAGEKWRSCRMAIPAAEWSLDYGKITGPGFSFSKICFVSDPGLLGNYEARAVSVTVQGPNDRCLEATGKGRALLVSSETAYPGWKVVLGGPLAKVVEVNHGFQGLVLEDGQESVLLAYRPTTFRLGAFFSLLACGFWTWMILKFLVQTYA